MKKLFDIRAIEAAILRFSQRFAQINDTISMRRESFTPVMAGNIIEAYRFLNGLLDQDMDLFTPAGLYALLEMNHIVLCGSDTEVRNQYFIHLAETRKSFLKKIRPIKDWVLGKRGETDSFALAAGFYARMLSQPQLFIEGNHRTGNILLNYLLVSKGEHPYIIDVDDAHLYLDLSSEIKFTNKENAIQNTLKMPSYIRRFQDFLRTHTREEFVCR